MYYVRTSWLFLLVSALCCSNLIAAPFPNTNQPTPGTLLSHTAPEMGRLAIIEVLGDYVITIPEMPSSPAGSDFIVRAWDISDPSNPREAYRFGETKHPVLAHGVVKRNNELYIGGYPNNAIRLNANGTLSHVPWSGPNMHWGKGGMMHPWSANNWWSYGTVSGNAWLALDRVETANWDHLGQTGVIGFPAFMGNILLYGADQSKTGMASYDVSNPSNPVLLDAINRPNPHPTFTTRTWDGKNEAIEGGIGGYWNEISHNYMVFARRGSSPGIQVVDFSDPSNLRMHCDFLTKDPRFGLGSGTNGQITSSDPAHSADPMYLGFQDEYAFSERYKLNIKDCTLALELDEIGNGVETSQYARPIGNLVVTGGLGSWQIPTNSAGMGIWVHQSTRDTRKPYVGYHIPKTNQTNYPIMAPISLMIPETLRSETIIVGSTLTLTEVGGGAVAIDYLLSHTGMLTVDPIEYLKPNTTYELQVENIEDSVRNKMARYSFRFSTGAAVISGGSSSSSTSSSVSTSSTSSSNISSSSSVNSSSTSSVSSASSSSAPAIGNHLPRITSFTGTPKADAIVGDTILFDVVASDSDGDSLEYRFRIQNLTNYTPWSSFNSFNYRFDTAGIYTVNAQVRDGRGGQAAAITSARVLDTASTAFANPTSSTIALSPNNNAVWVVNPDNNTLTRIDSESLIKEDEFQTGLHPHSIAIAADDSIWVSARDDDRIDIFSAQGSKITSLATGYGSAPSGIVIDQHNHLAYVALYNKGEVLRFNTNTREQTGSIKLAASVRALALNADGTRLLAARFISQEEYGEVWDIATHNLSLSRTFKLYPHLANDDLDEGRGLPNYLTSLVINNAGTRAYVVAKKDNIARGLVNGNDDLDDDNTVRTMAITLDLTTGNELRAERIDFDNTDSPSAVALTPNEDYLLVAMQGRNQVFAVSINANTARLGSIATQFTTGLAPQGLVLDREHGRLWVKNLMDRSVTAMELGNFLASGGINPELTTVSTVQHEILPPDVLRGKQLFYNAADGILGNTFSGRMSAEGYLSCATCHFDGGHDGRTYDFTGRGEGLRNNISLRGRSGVRFGNAHWSGNFDEVQDFENDIRTAFLGKGLMNDDDFIATQNPLGAPKSGRSADLDALAAYVSSLGKSTLLKSPERATNGALTSQATQGATLFQNLDCATCHSGKAFTDGALHDVGTLRHYSGQRLNAALTGIKTPSLLGLFDTAPYLHDGSATHLDEVFTFTGGHVIQAETLTRTGSVQPLVAQGFSYFRNGAAVKLATSGTLTLQTDVETTGTGSLRLRIGSNNGGSLLLTVNGVNQTLALPPLAQVDGQDVAFTEIVTLVELHKTGNTLQITLATGSSVIIDDLTLASRADRNKAKVHSRVQDMSSGDRDNLFAYLRQIDQQNAPEDTDHNVMSNTAGGTTSSAASTTSSAASSSVSSQDVNQNPGGSSGADSGGSKSGGSMPISLFILMLGYFCWSLTTTQRQRANP